MEIIRSKFHEEFVEKNKLLFAIFKIDPYLEEKKLLYKGTKYALVLMDHNDFYDKGLNVNFCDMVFYLKRNKVPMFLTKKMGNIYKAVCYHDKDIRFEIKTLESIVKKLSKESKNLGY